MYTIKPARKEHLDKNYILGKFPLGNPDLKHKKWQLELDVKGLNKLVSGKNKKPPYRLKEFKGTGQLRGEHDLALSRWRGGQ